MILAIMCGAVVSCASSAGKPDSRVSDEVSADVGTQSMPAPASTFNTDSAMAYLQRQVDFGPRVPGSDAHRRCADWIALTLRDMGYTVTDNTESVTHPVSGNKVSVRNIYAQSNPDATDRIVLLAHYDTRPWADHDADPSKHNTPIDGANDGASGVAVALEVARNISGLAPDKGVDILIVDLEDSGTYNDDESWCIGSRHWAEHLPYKPGQQPRFAVLLDMVGGKDAVFYREYFSEAYASAINDLVWQTAKGAGHGDRFIDKVGGAINDDHLSLLRAGIPAIDIIEMNVANGGFNPTWHTTDDNIDNIDPATINAVGHVITKLISSQYDN